MRAVSAVLLVMSLFASCDRQGKDHGVDAPTLSVTPRDEQSLAWALGQAQERFETMGISLTLSGKALHLKTALLTARQDELPADGALETLLRPVRVKIRPALRGCPGVCVIMLPRLASSASAASTVLPELEGLALGPVAWSAATDAPDAMNRLRSALGWPDRGGQTVVLLDAERWRRRDRAQKLSILLHELGHALGLTHRPTGPMSSHWSTQGGEFSTAERQLMKRNWAIMSREPPR